MTNPNDADESHDADYQDDEPITFRGRPLAFLFVWGLLVGFYGLLLLGIPALLVWIAGLAERYLGLPAIQCLVAFGIVVGVIMALELDKQLLRLRGVADSLEGIDSRLDALTGAVERIEEEVVEPPERFHPPPGPAPVAHRRRRHHR